MKYGLDVLATFPCMYQNTGAVSERIVKFESLLLLILKRCYDQFSINTYKIT